MTTYSEADKAEAIALAMTIGTKPAAAKLGIPWRNLYRWKRDPSPVVQAVVTRTVESMADKLTVGHERALDAVLGGLDDPTARLSDKATALRVLGEQSRLIAGASTANVAIRTGGNDGSRPSLADHLTFEEAAYVRQWMDAMLEERRRARRERGFVDPLYGRAHADGLQVDEELIDAERRKERQRLAELDDDDPYWAEAEKGDPVADWPEYERVGREEPVTAPEPDGPVVLVMDGPAPSAGAKRVGPPEPPKPEPRRLVNSSGEVVYRP